MLKIQCSCDALVFSREFPVQEIHAEINSVYVSNNIGYIPTEGDVYVSSFFLY